MKQREYFLCAKKTKIKTLFNNFFSSVSVFFAQEYHKACVCIHLLVNNVQSIRVQREISGSGISCAIHMHGTLTDVSKTDTDQKMLLSLCTKSILVAS